MATEDLGRLIFEIVGTPQKMGLITGKSHLAFYENGIAIDELGDHIEILKRNITTVYYSAPMVNDYGCLAVEIDHYDEGAIDTYTLGDAIWEGVFARVDRLLDCEWYEFRKPKLELPDRVKWFNAVNAVIALSSERDPDLFGGDVKSPDVAMVSREILSKYWRVNVRQDLPDRFTELYEGNPSKDAREIMGTIRNERGNPNNRDEGLRRYLEWMQSEYVVAWDMGRIIWIASLGYLGDYLSYDEAIAHCVMAGKKMQSLFNSWDEMFHHYIHGYIYWSGDDPVDEESEAHQRIAIYHWLKTMPNSPYRISWDTELEESSLGIKE
jgi:hypothetical protein